MSHLRTYCCGMLLIVAILLNAGIFGRTDAEIVKVSMSCHSLDITFLTFPICSLVHVNATSALMNVHAILHPKVPNGPIEKFNNVSINIILWRKESKAYKVYQYNVTHDVCDIIKSPRRYPFATLFFQIFRKHSNFNHTCPYDHDLIVKNLMLHTSHLRYVPLVNGEYMIETVFMVYNQRRSILKFTFTNK